MFRIEAAEVVLPCDDLGPTLQFFVDRLGLHVASIFPADDPVIAVVTGHGVRIRLDRNRDGDPGTIRLACSELPDVLPELVAPNGTRIELVEHEPAILLPELAASVAITHLTPESPWGAGRAGMRYRDLVPDRQGGWLIASHIQIPEGGHVPDYVHYHRVRFQMIYCYRGWVEVVYEDQGPPFRLEAGDCVLQPPGIRHRVLEASPGLEVIELGCPALHETHADLTLRLPTDTVSPEREFEGQRFQRHVAAGAAWEPWRTADFEARDLGMARATGGIARVHVARPRGGSGTPMVRHDGELLFMMVLDGNVTLDLGGEAPVLLHAGDACVVPPHVSHGLGDPSRDLQLLEVGLSVEQIQRLG